MNEVRRSKSDKMISGVISGFAKRYNLDVGLMRLLFFLFVMFSGWFPGVIAYIGAAFIIPEEEDKKDDFEIK